MGNGNVGQGSHKEVGWASSELILMGVIFVVFRKYYFSLSSCFPTFSFMFTGRVLSVLI